MKNGAERKLRPESTGKLIIVSAPSGAGKTTIVRHLLSQPFNLEFSVSATSRKPRGSECHGTDYYFISADEFKKRIDQGDFLEWEEVYAGVYYGTLKSEVERFLAAGKNVIFDVDVKGGLHIKEYYKARALSVFVAPPGAEALGERLRKRSTESEEKIAVRIAKASYELEFAPRFDIVLINDDLEKALKEAEVIVGDFLSGKKK